MPNYPQVSVVISTRNRCETLKKCLDSIAEQDYAKNLLELSVLDDASEDGTAVEIPKYLQDLGRQGFRKTYFFRNDENLSIAYGRWFLGQKASPESEMVLFVDDDAYLEPSCLRTLVEYMLTNPQVGVVGPRIVYANEPTKVAHRANFVGGWTARYRDKDSLEPILCDWVYSICCLVRSSALKATGGFYPGFFISHQEVDFCLQVKKKGYLVVYNPQTIVHHQENLNPKKRKRLYYLYRNKMLLIHRNFPFFRRIIALSLIVILGLPKYLLESIRFHKGFVFSELGTIFIAVWDGLLGRTGSLIKDKHE